MKENETYLSNSQVFTATAVSTNAIDCGVASDLGTGEPLTFESLVKVAMAGGTTVDFQIVQSTVTALTSPDVLISSGATALASLDAIGDKVRVTLPPGKQTKQFLGMRYVCAGTFSGGGAISTYLVSPPQEASEYHGI